jgi:hypothetical protein
MGRHASDAARKNFAAFGYEFFQEIRIFVIDRFDRDIDAPARHGAVGAAESGATFGGFRLHRRLLGFAVKSVFSKKRIVFFLLQSVWRARTFFIARAHVTRDRFAERLGLGAFESDDFLRHERLLFGLLRGRFFLFSFAAFLFGQPEKRGH